MMQVGTNQSGTYHSQPALSTTGGQSGRSSSSASRQQPQQSQYDTEQLANIRPRLCVLRKWPHYDGYGVHLARNQHWLGLRIGDVEPNSPAESGGLLREDVVLAVNGHSVENDDFFVILSFIQHELEADQIRFLVLDPHSADLARRHNLNIDENYRTCVRMETPTLTVSPEKLLYDQWRTTNAADPTAAQNTVHLGPTLSLNQEQLHTNAPRYQQTSPHDGRDDVYTFLPYSDHALENGKTFFEILFDQDLNPSTSTKPRPAPQNTTDDSYNKVPTGDHDDSKEKHRGSHIKEGIKNLAKTGIDNIKSIIPTKSHDDKDKSDKHDPKRKTSTGSIDHSHRDEPPSLVDKIKEKLKRSSSPTQTTDQEKNPELYNRLWDSSSPSQSAQDTNNNLGRGPHMCSVTLRPGDSIGISLQQDKDFSHIIKHVEPNSAADYAGIERDDCIISLNDIPLLHVTYQEVLNTLKQYRNDPNLDFLVAKKSYLLKSNQNNNNTAAEVLPSSNISDRNTSSTMPPTETLEQLYNKYNNEQQSSYDDPKNSNKARETVSTSTPNDRYDQRSSQFDNDRYPSKSQQGQILHGVGPATADRSSWGVSSGKSTDDYPLPNSGDSSVRSTSRDRRPDADDSKGRNSSLEDSFKPLQVGITNPTTSQQSGNVTPNLNDDAKRTSRPSSSNEQRDSSPKVSPGSNSSGANNRGGDLRQNETLQHIPGAVPITPAPSSSTKQDYDQGSSQLNPSNQADTRLGSTKGISVPSKPPKAHALASGYTDTDDDDLSDISERSREEDTSEPNSNKNSLTNLSGSSTKPTFGNTYDSSNQSPNLNNANRGLNSTNPNADQQISTPTTPARTVVKARRLDKSDSDDTMSESDRSSLPSTTRTKTNDQTGRLSEGNTPNNAKQTVQARRLEKTDSDDPQSGIDKLGNLKQNIQARRLDKTDSDDPRSGSNIPDNTKQTVQARRLEKTDSDDPKSGIDKLGNLKQSIQARRLDKTDSDDPRSEDNTSGIPRQVVQARRLEKTDSDENLSATDSHTTKQSAADSFYSLAQSGDDGTDTDERTGNSWRQGGKNANKDDKTADQKLSELLARSSNALQKQTNTNTKNDDDDDNDDKVDENSDDEHSSGESSTESQNTPNQYKRMALANMPISQLKDHGYELHDIQLMQPTETSPVGLKLTKQQDPLQYIITAVAKGTKADLAGLRVDDWLIKIDDKDIRLNEFSEVSQEIRQLLTNAGLINLVIARKKSSASSPSTKYVEKQQTPAIPSSSTRSDSLNRRSGGNQNSPSLLTTDITRDTPDPNQVRFTPDSSQNTSTNRSQRPPLSGRDNNINAPGGPLSVGITNPISDENVTRSPRSQSRSPSQSPTREFPVNRQKKTSLTEQPSDMINPSDIRHVVLKEASGLDFNSFIPEGDSQIQTHFISNVQPSSIADKAGLRDGDRILTINGVDVRNAVHEDVRQMMQGKKQIQISVVNDAKYLELIESVKQAQPKTEAKGGQRDSSSDSTNLNKNNELSKQGVTLFNDDKGTVQVKHCILKKEPDYNGYGLLLRYQNGLHLIDQVEPESPAFNCGLREDDVILFVDRKNVEQMTHDDVKILIRKLSLSNVNIDLILIRKNDISRYKAYQGKNTLNWQPILEHKLPNETQQIDQQAKSNTRVINDPISVPRQGSTSSSSNKQPAPAPPSSSSSTLEAGTRICTLQPSPERTAGFALSGKAPPPYVICQIEKNSPAEKAGLLLNDTLLSINGKPVTETSYEDTVALIKEALQKNSVELVVREQSTNQSRTKTNSQSAMPNPRNSSLGSTDSNNLGNHGSVDAESSTRGANAVEEYQKQRNKELSYTLRLCHLHPTNGDGTNAATFGFELSEELDYEYPLILRVESQSPAEGAGLQSRDILLKINDKKTKGLGYEKVKKEIEKAKRDGRLEMLVVDQETYDYCKRTKRPMKEPEMKVKHVFPKTENDVPTRTTTSSKGRAPSPPTFRNGHNRLDNPYVSQSLDTVTSNTTTILPASSIQDTVRSTISTGSFDYLRGPRRCVLKVDRNKGLGFVLSATGDYDHTITAVEKYSTADTAGLQVNDEVLEVDGVDVRNVKYEQVVDMLVSAMRTNESIEMRVIEGHTRDVYPSTVDGDKQTNTNNLLNSNNNNNTVPTSTIHSQRTTAILSDDLSDINSSISPFDSFNQQKIATSYPNLPGQLRQIDNYTSRALSGSVPVLATGITASPGIIHHPKSISMSSEKGSVTKLSDISSQDAPVARLCRVRKFATSPFYGFFLCGDPKKLGRVFISDVTKHSPAAVCGLRDGDRIIEINGTTIHALTYETILDKIKQHMARDDLELLVLDKKSIHWYRERNYPITSRTLPTIVHIEPILNETTSEMQSLEVPSTQTKMVGFADRRVSKTGL